MKFFKVFSFTRMVSYSHLQSRPPPDPSRPAASSQPAGDCGTRQQPRAEGFAGGVETPTTTPLPHVSPNGESRAVR